MVDIILAMVLIAILMVAGLNFATLAKGLKAKQDERLHAVFLASSMIEKLKYLSQYAWGTENKDLRAGFYDYTKTPIHIKPPAGWKIEYLVTDKIWEPGNPTTEYKEVYVTCTYGSAPQRTITLKGYVFGQRKPA